MSHKLCEIENNLEHGFPLGEGRLGRDGPPKSQDIVKNDKSLKLVRPSSTREGPFDDS